MKRISYLGVLAVVFLILMPFAPTYGHAQILLKEALGPGQQLKSAGGKLVIVSEKVNAVIVAPDSIMIPHGKNIKLKIGFYNLGDSPLEVSKDSVRVYLNGKKLKFISEKKLVKEIKRAFSSKNMDINKDQKKILAPFVEDKIRILKEEMLKKSTVSPKKNYWGTVVIKTPDDNKEMTIEVTLGGETHKINYNLISLK
jgi:hypothetical protein